MIPLPEKESGSGDRLIAGLLKYGTWIASAVIAVGIALEILQRTGRLPFPAQSGSLLVKAGVVLFILLPVARVMLMFILFLRARDHRCGMLAAFVLAMIGLGILIGL